MAVRAKSTNFVCCEHVAKYTDKNDPYPSALRVARSRNNDAKTPQPVEFVSEHTQEVLRLVRAGLLWPRNDAQQQEVGSAKADTVTQVSVPNYT